MTWLVSYGESNGVDEVCLTVGHLYRDDDDKLQLDTIYTLFGDEANTIARIIADKNKLMELCNER